MFRAVIVAALFLAFGGIAAASPVPHSAYPPGSSDFHVKTMTNPQWDCGWALSCGGGYEDPLYHSSTGEQLGRVSGWRELALTVRAHHKRIDWGLTGNLYDSVTAAENATRDFAATVGAMPAPDQPKIGDESVLMVASASPTLRFYSLVTDQGAVEVEGVAAYRPKGHDRAETERYLVRQVRAALAYELAASR